MRYASITLSALSVLLVSAGQVLGQARGLPYQSPPVSPYINLGRPQIGPAIDYYGIIRPQLDLRQNLQGLQQQVNTNEQTLGSITEPRAISPTGVAANFNTQYRYFMNRGANPSQNPTRPAGSFAPGAPGRGQLQGTPPR